MLYLRQLFRLNQFDLPFLHGSQHLCCPTRPYPRLHQLPAVRPRVLGRRAADWRLRVHRFSGSVCHTTASRVKYDRCGAKRECTQGIIITTSTFTEPRRNTNSTRARGTIRDEFKATMSNPNLPKPPPDRPGRPGQPALRPIESHTA